MNDKTITNERTVEKFLSQYSENVSMLSLKLRKVLLAHLPGITEQLDVPAKMIAYCYGQKYADMICTIIPSKTGVKLGFYKGTELSDPGKLLEGDGKVSRYVKVSSEELIQSEKLKTLIADAYTAWQKRTSVKS